MSIGFGLILVGFILSGGSFLYAIGNMISGIDNKGRSPKSVLKGNLVAMGAMVVGWILVMSGLAMIVVEFFQKR